MNSMSNKDMADKLRSLAQLDIDAVHAYDQAIDQIEHIGIRQQISQFREDHNHHVQNLSRIITELGETPPEFSRDFKGFFIEGFTALRSATGTEGALKAMQTNENMTNKKYDEARSLPFRQDIKAVVEQNYSDEQRHLRYIEQTLGNRSWEK